MNILLLGDLSWVTSKFCDVFKKEKHTLILANSNSLLDLSNISQLRAIPSNMILGMNSLEELYMRDDLILRETNEDIKVRMLVFLN